MYSTGADLSILKDGLSRRLDLLGLGPSGDRNSSRLSTWVWTCLANRDGRELIVKFLTSILCVLGI